MKVDQLKIMRLLVVSVLVGGSGWLFWQVRGVFAPFIVALLIAYLLEPLVQMGEKRQVSRVMALCYLYGLLGGILLIVGFWGMPKLISQLNNLVQILPEYMGNFQDYLTSLEKEYAKVQLPIGVEGVIRESLAKLEGMALGWVQMVLDGLMVFLANLLQIILIPILAFYFAKDKVYLQAQLWKLMPVRSRGELSLLWLEINQVLHGFLLGNLIVASLVAILTALGLMLIKMDFALIFGLVAGVFNIIPYFGPIIGMIPAVIFAFFISGKQALVVFLIMLAVQQIESNFISPKIIGEKVGVHPLVVIFALLAGGKLLGIWGLLFAVPLAGVLKVILVYVIDKTIRLTPKN